MDYDARARELAHEMIVVDTHVDLPYRLRNELVDLTVRTEDGHFDGVRAREGGLDAPFMSIYIPASLEEEGGAQEKADELIDLVESIAASWPDDFVVARSPLDVRAAFEKGQIALPMGMENGAPIESIEDLVRYGDRGISYITLTHSENNRIGDSSYAKETKWEGLSPFGEEVVAEMNRLGIMVDISHVSDATFDDVIALTKAPVIASHSSCRHFTPGFERNLDDERISKLAENGGVIQINFGSAFINGEAQKVMMKTWDDAKVFLKQNELEWDDPKAEEWLEAYAEEHPPVITQLTEVANQIDHVVELVGIEHVGLGSDYDGVEELPVGLEDVSKYPALFAELLRRGYSEEHLRLLAGENLLRVWTAVQDLAEGTS